MKRHQQVLFSDVIPDIPHRWDIKRSFIKRNSFPPALTYTKFLEHLRNALSHPTSPERGSHPSTGYTTLPDGSGVISFFRFIDSPWVDRGRIHSKASSSNEQKVKRTAEEFERSQGVIGLEVVRNSDGRYEIFCDQQLYLPLFEAELPLAALTELGIGLANHLAQPTVENWDGKTVHRLVA
jgi:hypothetical protein